MRGMSKAHTLLIASAVAAAMVLVGVGVVAASAAGRGVPTNFLAAASPTPSPGVSKPNEDAAHEATESTARETAENNGTFHPGGPGGPGGGRRVQRDLGTRDRRVGGPRGGRECEGDGDARS